MKSTLIVVATRIWSSNFAFQEVHKKMIPVTIPLKFFFCRRFEAGKSDKPYFPLCAIYKQKIEFEIEFHKKTFFTPTTQSITLPYFNIVTDEISLTDEERLFFVKEQNGDYRVYQDSILHTKIRWISMRLWQT